GRVRSSGEPGFHWRRTSGRGRCARRPRVRTTRQVDTMRPQTPHGSDFRPVLENLDVRNLCSVALGGDGVLRIICTDGPDGTWIRQVRVNNQDVIQVDQNDYGAYPRHYEFPAPRVVGIYYEGRGGDDSYENTTTKAENAFGGPGSDTMVGSRANTHLDGGAG